MPRAISTRLFPSLGRGALLAVLLVLLAGSSQTASAQAAARASQGTALEHAFASDVAGLAAHIYAQARARGDRPHSVSRGLASIRTDVDVDPAPGPHGVPGVYDLLVMFTKASDGRFHPQNVTNVFVNEDIQHGDHYVSLNFVRDARGAWVAVDAFATADDPFADNPLTTHRAGTRPRIFGIPEPVITPTQLRQVVAQANQLLDAAAEGAPIHLYPPAWRASVAKASLSSAAVPQRPVRATIAVSGPRTVSLHRPYTYTVRVVSSRTVHRAYVSLWTPESVSYVPGSGRQERIISLGAHRPWIGHFRVDFLSASGLTAIGMVATVAVPKARPGLPTIARQEYPLSLWSG